jgi:hypothetical protein
MGWGICFAIDDKYRIYCADGCKWRASESDYHDFHPWPSAREYVLEYFEGPGHSELDMIRDECPGTASALASACPEHMSYAFSYYDRLSSEEKEELHKNKLAEFEAELEHLDAKSALEDYKTKKRTWTEYKKNPPKLKNPKSRADELEQEMYPMKLELEMEKAAQNVDWIKKEKARLNRLMKLEKLFVGEC